MKRLNIENFLNEMSYDLRMEDLDKAVIKYQEVLIEYFMNAQFSYKEKKRFHEVCEIVRSDRYMRSMEKLINQSDDMLSDMSYVLVTSTDFGFVEGEIKANAMRLAYVLREPEIKSMTKNVQMEQVTCALSVWSVRGYETKSYFRIKCAEKVIKRMPGALYNGFYETHKPSAFNSKILFHIISMIIPDVAVSEIISAFFKSEFKYKSEHKYFGYATRLRSFLYELCAVVDPGIIITSLTVACSSMINFNERNNANENFSNKYLNYQLLRALSQDKSIADVNSKRLEDVKSVTDMVTRFIINNPKYKSLF